MARCVLAMQAEGLSLDSYNPSNTGYANPWALLTRSEARTEEFLEAHRAASLEYVVSERDLKVEGEDWHPRLSSGHCKCAEASVYLYSHS